MHRRRVAVLAALLVGGTLIGLTPEAHAATTLFVNNAVEANCDDTTSDSVAIPYCKIQAAVDDAVDGDTIQVAAGTYTASAVSFVVMVNDKDIIIDGAGEVSIIDGGDARGGIQVLNSAVTIKDLKVANTFSASSGAGIQLDSSGAHTITDVTIDGATSVAPGGGIYLGVAGSVTLTRVHVLNASGSTGGGLDAIGNGTVDIIDSSFSNNTGTSEGGAIHVDSTGLQIEISNSTFTDNVSGNNGGAIHFNGGGSSSLSVTTSWFHSNDTGPSAGVGGGAIYATNATAFDITYSTFTENTSTNFGGGVADLTTTGLARIENSTFQGNTAAFWGGGIFSGGSLNNVTLTGNEADGGGGVQSSGSALTMSNSIVYGNTGATSGPDCQGGIVSGGYNLIGNLTDCSQTGDTASNIVGEDPLLSALALNGGPTKTMAIASGSPARDAGNPAAPGSGGGACELTDQRGEPRDDGACDIGAYELQSVDTVGLVDPGAGLWYLRDAVGVVSQFYYGVPGDVPFVGDWDCDGIDTPGLYRQTDGFVYLRNTNSFGVADVTFFFGLAGDIPIAGDFDDDGCDSLGIYRPSEGRVYISDTLGSNGGFFVADYNYYFGNPGDKPFSGDFDGDGVDTIGLHRESTGFVYFRNTHSFGIADNSFFFGIPDDRLVAGDWGIIDGIDTPAVFRPSATTFFFRHTNTQGNADSQFVWGQPTWLPIAGNYGL